MITVQRCQNSAPAGFKLHDAELFTVVMRCYSCNPHASPAPRCSGLGNDGRLQAIGSEVESNEIRLLRLMLRQEVKSGTAAGGTRGFML